MGRSKFPGKPSKSINRKRISVLQLDPNNSVTTPPAAATETSSGPIVAATTATNTHNTSSSTVAAAAAAATTGGGAASATSAAAQANSEDEEATQTKAEEERDENDEADEELRAADKHKNGKREHDDDDYDEDGPPATTNATTGQRQTSATAAGTTTTTSSQNQQQQQQQQQTNNNNSHHTQQQNHSNKPQTNSANCKTSGPSLSAKVVATNNSHSSNNKLPTKRINRNKQQDNKDVALRDEPNEGEMEQHGDNVDEDDEEDVDGEDEGTLLKDKDKSKRSLPVHQSATIIAQLKFPQRNCKKFKNLNINKPEVMLPSSTKLKLQQQQQKQQQETSKATTVPAPQQLASSLATTVANPTNEAEPVNNTQQQQHQQQQQPQICEMSSSSSTTSASAASITTTSAASASSSTTTTRFNKPPLPQQHTTSDDDDDHTPTPKIGDRYNNNSNITASNDDLQHSDHDHRCHAEELDNDDAAVADEAHAHHADDDGDNDVVENSSSHNELKSCPNTSDQDSVQPSELHSEDQRDECKSRLKQNPSSITSVAMETTTTVSNGSSSNTNTSSASSSSTANTTDKKQKKTVTFKNVLETSDDKSAVKKFYNPDNRKPLISIIKKECLNRPLMYTRSSECIVRPSRLTEILKNNSNIDKLNSLKFRSNNNGGIGERNTSSVLAGPLSRVFGAPTEDEAQQQKQSLISFRLAKNLSEDEDDDEDDDDEEDEEEEEEEDDDDEDEDDEDNEEEDIENGEEGDRTKPASERTAGGLDVGVGEVESEVVASGAAKESLNVIKSNLAEDKNEDDQQMIIDKHFVLPKRSCRSSRVIKPNKRLLEDGTICKKSSLKPISNSTSMSSTATATATASSSSSSVIKEEKPAAVTLQTNYFGLGDFKAKDCNGLTTSKLLSKDLSSVDAAKPTAFAVATSNVFSNFALNSGSSSSLLSSKPSNFILRQPRLQFESLSAAAPVNSISTNTSDRNNVSVSAAAAAALALSASLPKSLLQAISSLPACTPSSSAVSAVPTVASMLSPSFSLNGTSALKNNVNATPISSLSPSSILCVVCSSTIHTKNLPQASKYGQLSCEYCRKFISKIAKKSLAIKNSTINKPIIPQCKADGNCIILPLNKGIHIKNFKKLYKERCGLCWLKKCLQTLQLPKVRLNALMPVLNAVIGNKTNMMESKIRKELEALETTKPLIKWKPTSLEATTLSLSSTMAGDGGIKLNLKTNSLTENNSTFGSTPLLRPAILEKPTFLKTSVLETKQEITEKPERKPLEILKDVKVETVAMTEVPPSKSKRKDRTLEKERKEVKIKELPSPKIEDKLKDSKEHIEKTEEMDEETGEQPVDASSINTSCSNTTTTPTTSNVVIGTATLATATSTALADKRQRIDLKGPRVKHVCRSASIVLGQPLAMFGEDEEDSTITAEDLQQSLENGEVKLPLTDENDNCASCKPQQQGAGNEDVPTEPPPLKAAKVESISASTGKGLLPTSKLSQRPHHYNTQLTAYKKQFSSQMVATASSALMPQRRKEPQMKCKLLISIDFWENYDPAEVCQTGFGLIVTETVAQRALCFLCGSAGQEPLIFCACCCEPYHQYCVQDEFNLKHGSLDDTLLLNDSCLSITGLASNSNTAIAKLNWLCPRCTVCYTCNMSSGAKVKCQKCQKNYHSTCLGTSKRLLGADRPLICVNCLKCRSCSTTKVTKFVGNLPMCTNCFKLRKKGNYCPVCQKCYDDQDFDLKMMECGDCRQWVHAKCETLTDEQYNLLSTLPESIEFICKRCSRKSSEAKQRACDWREAVQEEFKSNLMSVLKLLSKSRQACSLLRLSPRKQMKCSCGTAGAATQNSTKYQPKSLQFNQEQSTQSLNIDVYEFDDHEKETEMATQPLTLEKKCVCQQTTNATSNHLSLVEIKQKISNGSYGSLAEFNYDMTLVIQQANCDELVIVYKEILSEQFPWFQNETQACTDALEEDMYEASGGAYGLNTSLESESDYQMDCLPSSGDHQEEAERSALLAELPHDLEELLYNIKKRQDSRICLFCRRSGEGLPNEEARLLYCGHDCWVHTNCALWSAEVFEEIDGSLQNVHSAVARGRMIKCSVCGNRGATVGCNVKSCGEHYHYPCARSKNCAFLADKSMYCPTHSPSSNNSKISFETQFDVMRPVYVELERKRKKLVEPAKVQFHIGSLEVKQLGHILPRFSDTYEAVVPVNFLCSRLYWSSKEPWKIVEYTVRTYIHNSSNSTLSGACLDLGKNFTVDHSQTNGALIQLGLSQIQQWHLSLAKGEYDAMEEYDYLNNFPQISSSSGGGTQETSGTNDEEPQTNADLLPPEIKEAIFEDLPGDLLEGISMLDIFTKCMNYEDMAQGEQSQTPLTDEDTMTSIGAFTKQLTAEFNNGWPNTTNVTMVEDALLTTSQAVKLQKLKKSSSPVISCDVNAKNAIKRRKISENMLISLNQHQRSQKKDCSSASRRLDLETSTKRTFTWSAEKRYNLEAPTNTAPSDSKIRLMQVDGVDDSITEYRFITQDATAAAIKCERCQCTYRNIESFQRHMPSCEPMSSSTSESESDNNAHATEVTTNGITLEQLQELNNKLQQQQQQRTTQIPFLQAIPAQTLSQLQGLQTANIQTLPLQLQGVQNLQNLQNLQQLQQLTQPQSLGGNFFISTAQPDVSNTTTDLHMYANALQGLTANLNGTFTVQPATNTYTTSQPVPAQNQPPLLAVSTNADGTQQIIQLPAQASAQGGAATYQTLQATNSDKKIILPVGGGKPMKTMATKAAQQAAAKNKLKATTAVKPIQSKMNVAQATHMQAPQTVNATQLLNQQLLQQLQQAQQSTNAPQIVFQQSAPTPQQPQIIMQQPQNIISFVTTTNDGSQQPQLQYVTLPTSAQATHEYKPQTHASTLFTAANTQPLMQSAYLQTDASGNLVLTNAPQTTTPLQLLTAPQTSQVIGTLIQPQTLQLQGGNVITTSGDGGIPQAGSSQTQQQVIFSGGAGATPTGLEMLTAGNTPQVILATSTPPMYYGLETIVQNTVMSSQQFVSTAMPGVLSQNASFSATTTQVFQASKIEPLVDIPAGYVLLNNVDANNAAAMLQPQQQTSTQASNAAAQANQANFIQAALQQQAAAASLAEQQQHQQQHQQHQHQHQQQTANNVYRIQTPPVSTAQSYQLQPQIVVTPTQAQQQPATTQYVDTNTGTVYSAKVAPVAQVKRTKSTTTPVATVTKVQPQVVNKVMPNVAQVTQATPQSKLKQSAQVTQNSVKNNAQMAAAAAAVAATINNTQAQVLIGGNQAQAMKQPSAEVSTPPSQTLTNHPVVAGKKTNMIRPLNKAEVKPKVMKTAAATVVTKASPVTPVVNNNSSNNTINVGNQHLANNPNKMIVLKPQMQQQQQLQQQPVEQKIETRLSQTTASGGEEDSSLITINNLTENNLNPEFINLQHVSHNPHQHYNVADALLLDENSEMAQQPLSHCSYSNTTTTTFETNHQQTQQQQQQQQSVQVASESVSNILPTIQRMPQYTNINIVNPLQQYSAANTLTTSSSTTATTVTRPTNRVLPMQQKTYEQHTATCTTNSSMSSTITSAFCTSSTTTTTAANSQVSGPNTTTNTVGSEEASTMIKTNINKIAYEAEVKQMLLHSPNPQHEVQQATQQQHLHQQQQHVMHMQQTLIHKASPPPLAYDINEKTAETSKMCYVSNPMQPYVEDTTGAATAAAEECLITDPKFPPEGEVMLGSDCCENDEEALVSVTAEDNDEEEEDDDGFSLKMPSANCSDNLSMDSDEPAVKEKISKILDNLTNEDCNDSLNTNTTLEAHAEVNCNSGGGVNYLQHPSNTEDHLPNGETGEYYAPSPEETTALIAAQLAVENIKEKLQEKLQPEVNDPLTNEYLQHCQNSLMPQTELTEEQVQQQNNTTLTSAITMSSTNPPPKPPARHPKRVSGPHLLYEIQSEDGFTYKSTSITEVWEKVFEAVQVARRANGLAPLPDGPLADMSGVQMIGLKTNALKYLIEQLPGVEKCTKYTPKYHKRNSCPSQTNMSISNSSASSMGCSASVSASLDLDGNSIDYTSDQEELNENPFDCARCEPYSKRSEYDMFSWLASRHRKQPVQVFVQPSDNELVPRRGTGSNLPMAMKYRTLKETYKDYVGVFRSHIHGRGLYCTKDIEAGEMVIEYAGELIRSTLTDQRERYYNSRGIGCYMFKIDDNLVVDATMRGNAARFINHSCEPNCYSKVVDILGHKHIIIFALRRIVQGEELTYDYKFPFEDEKIPCSCGSKKCRKYLN